MIHITRTITIDESEIQEYFVRASGPGGQHVNKVSSRVTLYFDIDASPSLTPAQKLRLKRRLGTRISRAGLLRVISRKHRSQAANRRAATERLAELIRGALKRKTVRKKTAVPAAEKRRRMEQKRRRAKLKQDRGRRLIRDRET